MPSPHRSLGTEKLVLAGRSLAAILFLICVRVSLPAQSVVLPTSGQVQSPTQAEVLKKIDELVEQNGRLEKQNQELMVQMEALRRSLGEQGSASVASTAAVSQPVLDS